MRYQHISTLGIGLQKLTVFCGPPSKTEQNKKKKKTPKRHDPRTVKMRYQQQTRRAFGGILKLAAPFGLWKPKTLQGPKNGQGAAKRPAGETQTPQKRPFLTGPKKLPNYFGVPSTRKSKTFWLNAKLVLPKSSKSSSGSAEMNSAPFDFTKLWPTTDCGDPPMGSSESLGFSICSAPFLELVPCFFLVLKGNQQEHHCHVWICFRVFDFKKTNRPVSLVVMIMAYLPNVGNERRHPHLSSKCFSVESMNSAPSANSTQCPATRGFCLLLWRRSKCFTTQTVWARKKTVFFAVP